MDILISFDKFKNALSDILDVLPDFDSSLKEKLHYNLDNSNSDMVKIKLTSYQSIQMDIKEYIWDVSDDNGEREVSVAVMKSPQSIIYTFKGVEKVLTEDMVSYITQLTITNDRVILSCDIPYLGVKPYAIHDLVNQKYTAKYFELTKQILSI